MPRPRKSVGKRKGGPLRKGKGKRSAPKMKLNRQSKVNVPEMASLTCNKSMVPVQSGSLYVSNDIKLSDFIRAAAVGSQYQRFRISGITWTVKPNMDSFTTVAAGLPQKPYIYYMIDKGGNIPTNITLEGLKAMGCRPHRLDEKPFTITYRPGVTFGVLDFGVGSQYQQYKTSPWLATNKNAPGATPTAFAPSEVSHLGLKFFIEQVGVVTTYNLDVAVQFQFIKPGEYDLPGSSVPGREVQYAIPDDSPDGVAHTNDLSGNIVV